MTLDELRENAEAAKAWRPKHFCKASESHHTNQLGMSICLCNCEFCLGARRSWIDVGRRIDRALNFPPPANSVCADQMVELASDAARIASYFAAEPNPVSIFRDAVKEAVK